MSNNADKLDDRAILEEAALSLLADEIRGLESAAKVTRKQGRLNTLLDGVSLDTYVNATNDWTELITCQARTRADYTETDPIARSASEHAECVLRMLKVRAKKEVEVQELDDLAKKIEPHLTDIGLFMLDLQTELGALKRGKAMALEDIAAIGGHVEAVGEALATCAGLSVCPHCQHPCDTDICPHCGEDAI